MKDTINSQVFESMNPQAPEAEVLRFPYGGGEYQLTESGLFYIGIDKDGNKRPPVWVCAPIKVLAQTRDNQSNYWGRLLEWNDNDGITHQWAMPISMLNIDGAQVRSVLMSKGLSVAASKPYRELLSIALQVWPQEKRAVCVPRIGWYKGVYVLPTYCIGETKEQIVYQSESTLEPAFSIKGTPEEWCNHVARLAEGNSRIVFSIATAFAAPLLELVGMEGGGFHFRGSSSIGKSTGLKVAASVWGNPHYVRSWSSTANGLAGMAAMHNDGLLILDEINEISDPTKLGEIAYSFSNGRGKTRADRSGNPQPAAQWKLLFLSTGEQSMQDIVAAAGKKTMAGQEVRMADIDAETSVYGSFEDIHEYSEARIFAETIETEASRFYGAVGEAWLHHIVQDRPNLIPTILQGIDDFIKSALPSKPSPQAARVAKRFALVSMAGELATHYGLTGWEVGEAENAAKTCFLAWLEGFGVGNREERTILDHVRLFIEMHGASRFENINASDEQRIPNRAGFYRRHSENDREFLVLSEVFKHEVCAGFDQKNMIKILINNGVLIPDNSGKSTQNIRLPNFGQKRVYVLRYLQAGVG